MACCCSRGPQSGSKPYSTHALIERSTGDAKWFYWIDPSTSKSGWGVMCSSVAMLHRGGGGAQLFTRNAAGATVSGPSTPTVTMAVGINLSADRGVFSTGSGLGLSLCDSTLTQKTQAITQQTHFTGCFVNDGWFYTGDLNSGRTLPKWYRIDWSSFSLETGAFTNTGSRYNFRECRDSVLYSSLGGAIRSTWRHDGSNLFIICQDTSPAPDQAGVMCLPGTLATYDVGDVVWFTQVSDFSSVRFGNALGQNSTTVFALMAESNSSADLTLCSISKGGTNNWEVVVDSTYAGGSDSLGCVADESYVVIDNEEWLKCYTVAGTLAWTYTWPATLTAGFRKYCLLDGEVLIVYIYSGNTEIVCKDVTDGSTIWSRTVPSAAGIITATQNATYWLLDYQTADFPADHD